MSFCSKLAFLRKVPELRLKVLACKKKLAIVNCRTGNRS